MPSTVSFIKQIQAQMYLAKYIVSYAMNQFGTDSFARTLQLQ